MTTTHESKLTSLLGCRFDLAKLRDDLIAAHKVDLEDLRKRIERNEIKIGLENHGLDSGRIERATQVIAVTGLLTYVEYQQVRENTQRRKVVNDAIQDLATGPTKLRSGYLGTKNYSQWSDQREDHDYGYGPKHGSIVFSVGLVNRGRNDLTDQQVDDAVWYLHNLPAIEAAMRGIS